MTRLLVLFALLGSAPASAETLSLRTRDGVAVSAEASGSGSRCVVLVHDDAGRAADWDTVRQRLATHDVQVVAVGLRGQAGARDADTLARTPDDVAAAVAWLRARGVADVVLLGAGAGGTVALHAAAVDPAISGVVLVSPRLSTPGFQVAEELAAYGQRPLMLVASASDATASRAVQALAGRAAGPVATHLVDTAGAGARLVADAPRLESELLAWLTKRPTLHDPTKPKSALSQGEVDAIETTGTRYGK